MAIVVLVCLHAAPAWGGNWSIGSHFGAGTVTSRANSGSSGVFALPSNVLTYQPGFRVGFGTERRSHDIHVDLGSLVIDQAGSTLSLVAGSMSYQFVWKSAAPLGFIANTGIGFFREGGAAKISVNTSYGVGVGVRRVIREDAGAVRMEARLDYLRGDESIDRPNLATLGVRLGFDLWL